VVSINALALLLVLPWVGVLIDLCRQAIQAVA
jgi:hypothetical protein